VHDKLHDGTSVRVRGPRNHFPLVSSPRYQFIAGGIGVTPMLPMIAAAEATGAHWQLLYGGRKLSSMAFVDELQRYGECVTVCSRDDAGGADFRARLESRLAEPSENTLVYCCGPEGLLSTVEDACKAWPGDSLHLERFSAKALEEPVAGPHWPPSSGMPALWRDFDCCHKIKRSTKFARKPASMCSARYGGRVRDVWNATSSRARVITVTSVLNDAEKAANDTLMICVSRSRSERLVLDL